MPKVAFWATKLNLFIDPSRTWINQKTLHFSQFLGSKDGNWTIGQLLLEHYLRTLCSSNQPCQIVIIWSHMPVACCGLALSCGKGHTSRISIAGHHQGGWTSASSLLRRGCTPAKNTLTGLWRGHPVSRTTLSFQCHAKHEAHDIAAPSEYKPADLWSRNRQLVPSSVQSSLPPWIRALLYLLHCCWCHRLSRRTRPFFFNAVVVDLSSYWHCI